MKSMAYLGAFLIVLSFLFANIWFWGCNNFCGYCAAACLLIAEFINKNLTEKIVDKAVNS